MDKLRLIVCEEFVSYIDSHRNLCILYKWVFPHTKDSNYEIPYILHEEILVSCLKKQFHDWLVYFARRNILKFCEIGQKIQFHDWLVDNFARRNI